MNYIQQAYKGQFAFWKYLMYSMLFLGFMALNIVVSILLDLDTEKMIKQSIEAYGANITLAQLLWPSILFLGLLFIWVKFVHKQSITTLTTSRKKIDWKRIFFSFSLWAIITTTIVLVAYFVNPEETKINFQLQPFLILCLISIILIPIQTSFEEYFFRGYLLQGIGAQFKSRILPLCITSIVFGLMHYGNPEVAKLGDLIMIYYIGTGFFLGIITLMDEGLELALGFHAANNLVTALLITSDWTAFQTNSIFKDFSQPDLLTTTFMPVFVIFPTLLFIFSKKYNWSNWKEKLFGKIEKPLEIEQNQFS